MNTNHKKIVIVDDDTITQKLYHDVLTKEGYVVVQAYEAKEGLNLIKSSHPDLIILDIMIPGGMNGFDILETVKADADLKAIPVLIFTNLDSEEKIALSIGASDYVIKSNISINDIPSKVRQYLPDHS